ncbi:hypothetical protein K8B69_29415 [Pseudomonas aeruginosa]|nr:hypothetical protein K8B69_29415 [Pseudomonas aeruginosa]
MPSLAARFYPTQGLATGSLDARYRSLRAILGAWIGATLLAWAGLRTGADRLVLPAA